MGTRTATDLTRALRRRELNSGELLPAYRARTDKLNPAINAVVTWDDRAGETDRLSPAGEVIRLPAQGR